MLCMSPFAKLHKLALDRVGEHVYFMAVGCSVYFVLFLVMVFGGELPRTRHTGIPETKITDFYSTAPRARVAKLFQVKDIKYSLLTKFGDMGP